ncbi:hypothetical protein K7432_000174 [Basidiobolus ranarum]|uniref:Uncharacterized protein n=1 Tax=Basidiobolus ranarum TaxID=34480 RepID=A0ABR2X508_9FUNG
MNATTTLRFYSIMTPSRHRSKSIFAFSEIHSPLDKFYSTKRTIVAQHQYPKFRPAVGPTKTQDVDVMEECILHGQFLD